LGELVEAVRAVGWDRLGAKSPLLRLANGSDPASVPAEKVNEWTRIRITGCVGMTDDVKHLRQATNVRVLPSCDEGVPHALLEASAMSRLVITTDAPGCRDAIVDGETGFTCRVRDGADLGAAMRRFLALPPRARREMGARGWAFVEAHHDERIVIDRYLALVDEIGSDLPG